MGTGPGSDGVGARRNAGLTAIAGVALMACACAPKAEKLAKAPWPERRAGLWEERIVQAGRADRPRTMRICLDPLSERRVSLFGLDGSEDCSRNAVQRPDGGYDFTSTCRLPTGALVTAQGRADGDFDAAYHVHTQLTLTHAPISLLNGRREVDVTAVWAGRCPADMAPGQVLVGDKSKLRLNARLHALASAFAGV